MGESSIRKHLKMQNLFVRDISKACSPSVVRATLERAGGPLCKVVIPLDFKTDQSTHIGQAYLNFASQAEAECCLEKVRFKLVFAKQRAKILYAPGNSQTDKDKVWGPYSYKFQIIVKNLSEEVEVEAFYDFFSKFGEILQCKTDTDSYGQYFGQVQYMDTSSVAAAVDGANGTRWHGAVIQVVPHHKAAHVDSASTPRPQVDVSSPSSFPSLGAPSSSTATATPTAAPAPAAATSAPSRLAANSKQLPAPALSGTPMAAAAAVAAPSAPPPINFAVQALERSGGSGNSFGTGADSPGSRPLAAFSGSGSDLHVGAPVVAPLALPVAAPVAAPFAAPGATAAMADVPRPIQPDFSGATTGPGARPTAGGTPSAIGRLSLLDRIMQNRAEAAAVGGGSAATVAAVAAAPAGPGVVGMAQPGTPNANGVTGSGRVNGNRKKGGLIKSLVQTLDQVSELLCCPITHEVLRDPVVAADGITYERRAITEWLATHDTSPMTNITLANRELHPNNLVRTLIEELM